MRISLGSRNWVSGSGRRYVIRARLTPISDRPPSAARADPVRERKRLFGSPKHGRPPPLVPLCRVNTTHPQVLHTPIATRCAAEGTSDEQNQRNGQRRAESPGHLHYERRFSFFLPQASVVNEQRVARNEKAQPQGETGARGRWPIAKPLCAVVDE